MKSIQVIILATTLLGFMASSMSSLATNPTIVTVVVKEIVQESAGSNIGKAAECMWDATYNIGCGIYIVGKACYQAMPSSLTVTRALLQTARVARAGSQVLADHPVLLAGLVGFGAGCYMSNSDILARIKSKLPGSMRHVTLRIVDTSGRLIGWATGRIS